MCAQEKQFTGQAGNGLLWLVATPIGNLGDITHRALECLANADRIYCEDRRISGKLLQHYQIATVLDNYHEHNATQKRPEILAKLAEGQKLALISDAGTPLISDPGYKLVAEVLAAGHRVEPIPGACAVVAALCASGLPTDCFSFTGFLHPKGKAREDGLAQMAAAQGTVIFYETAPKLNKTLSDLMGFAADRQLVIMREITKRFEERISGTVAELTERLKDVTLKGELVLLLSPAAADTSAATDYDTMLRAALKHVSVKDAAAVVAAQTGAKKQDVYSRALELKNG